MLRINISQQSVVKVLKAYKYRFYPTKEQSVLLAKTFGSCRFVYNHFLCLKQKKWKEENQSLSYGDCSSLLSELKKTYEWLKEVSSVCLQQCLRHLQSGFNRFFKRIGGYPSFKSKRNHQSASFMKNSFSFKNGQVKLAKCKEDLDIRWSRRFSGTPSSLTVSKTPSGKYFVSLLVEEKISPLPEKSKVIGLDLGIKNVVIDQEGNKISNPRLLDKHLKKLKRKSQALSRKKKGSNNRNKARLDLAKLHEKIRNKRMDFLHKLSTKLVNENQVIVLENLQVKKMQKRKSLSRRIADSSWGTLSSLIEYKCSWYKRAFVKVDKYFPSSKMCSNCGHTLETLELSVREWECSACSVKHDRDVNAAKNILKEGLRLFKESLVPWDTRDFKPVESS